jgi:UDP-N-acetylglucosamine 1-carboxyvinyltransferase
MDLFVIDGNSKLNGEIEISGSKNAALPLMALSILAKDSFVISNVPMVNDAYTLVKLLKMLGAQTDFKNNVLTINTSSIQNTTATYDIVRTMRASILTLGPLLARFGKCEVSLPGGCAIGQRPIDLHLKALEAMGAEIEIKQGYVVASAPNGLKGATIVFDKITVTGTENIMMAAALANGETRLVNVAKEPEVVQLAEVLKKSGVEIEGIGTNEITIKGSGGELLDIDTVSVIPDRIEAGTYLCAGAITNSQIKIKNIQVSHIDSITSKLIQMGFGMEFGKDWVMLIPAKEIKPVNITTSEYPGFPTDMQAQFMALATHANVVSVIEERMFENRFMHVSELQRMGAQISLHANTATITGKSALLGTDVMATDLRASSALVLAALVAFGETRVHRIYHLDRGYEGLEKKFSTLGATLKRESE